MLKYNPDAKDRYTWNGEKAASVTEVIGHFYPPFKGYTEFHASRGSAVHAGTAIIDAGSEIELETIDRAIIPYLEAYKRFLEECQFQSIHIEKSLYSPSLRVAGTPDRIGYLVGLPTILDIKTGVKAEWHPLQTAAYQYLANENRIVTVKRVALYLRESGKYSLESHENAGDIDRFKLMCGLYLKSK